jgi:hypothetical protein
MNNLMMDLKFLEKQEQVNPQSNRWKDIIKIRAKISEQGTKRKVQ